MRLVIIFFSLFTGSMLIAQPTITNFSPNSGSIGTLVTITGTNLQNETAVNIRGVSSIVISYDGSTLVAMVMPGATSGSISVTTGGGHSQCIRKFYCNTVTDTHYTTGK